MNNIDPVVIRESARRLAITVPAKWTDAVIVRELRSHVAREAERGSPTHVCLSCNETSIFTSGCGFCGKSKVGRGSSTIRKIVVRTEHRTVFDVVRRIGQGQYVMAPEFQRDLVWDVRRQSRLVESMLIGVPIPVFYLAENQANEVVVVDGLQRLATFVQFLTGRFALKLDASDLRNKKFDDLSAEQQRAIEDTQLVIYVVEQSADDDVMLDIFDRVNSGVALTRQQMRNCLYQGPGTRWLRDEAVRPLFVRVTGGGFSKKLMRDREVLNKFAAAVLLGTDDYRSKDDFLARGIRRMNCAHDVELESLSARLARGLQNNHVVFGDDAFRRVAPGSATKRNRPNISLFEVMAVGLSHYSEGVVETCAPKIRAGFHGLLDNQEFVQAITRGTDNGGRFRFRFSCVRDMLRRVVG